MSSIEEMMKKYPNPAYELEKELEDIEASDISNIKKMELALEAKENYKKNHTHMNTKYCCSYWGFGIDYFPLCASSL